MLTKTEIETAVRNLSREELAEFRAWFTEYDNDAWDREMEEDVKSGKLDKLFDDVRKEIRQGRTTPL